MSIAEQHSEELAHAQVALIQRQEELSSLEESHVGQVRELEERHAQAVEGISRQHEEQLSSMVDEQQRSAEQQAAHVAEAQESAAKAEEARIAAETDAAALVAQAKEEAARVAAHACTTCHCQTSCETVHHDVHLLIHL